MIRAWTGAGFPLGLLLALAMLTAWLQHAVEFPDERHDGKRRHDPDYFVEHALITKLDASGSLQYTTRAERIVHFPDTDTTEMSKPRIHYLRPGRPPLDLRADSAWASAGGEEIRLNGNVVVERTADARHATTTAKTDHMTVFPDEERALTNAPVLITQGASRLHGVGMVLDNQAQTFVLQSKVTGQFESKRNHP